MRKDISLTLSFIVCVLYYYTLGMFIGLGFFLSRLLMFKKLSETFSLLT